MEEWQEFLPVHLTPRPANLLELLLLGRSQPFQKLVLEREEELIAARVALAAAAANQLAINAASLVALRADDVQAAGLGDARRELDVGASAGHVGGDSH